jgi:hypothetical protein
MMTLQRGEHKKMRVNEGGTPDQDLKECLDHVEPISLDARVAT